MKNLLIFFAIIIGVSGITLAYSHYQKADKAKSSLNEERYLRMTAEEALTNAEAKVRSLESEFDRTQKKMQTFEKSIEQLKSTNDSLRTQLDRALQSNKAFEEKLKQINDMHAPKASAESAGSS